MAEFPALPLWTDAFLADTVHLDAEQSGAYLLLLMAAWRRPNCDLPADPALLRRWAKVPPRRWPAVWTVVEPFFNEINGVLVQKRLVQERVFVSAKRAQRVDAGHKSALKRLETRATTALIPFQREGNEASTPTPTPTSIITPLPPQAGAGDKSEGGPKPKPSRADGTNPRAVEQAAEAEASRKRHEEFLAMWASRVELYRTTGEWRREWRTRPEPGDRTARRDGIGLPDALWPALFAAHAELEEWAAILRRFVAGEPWPPDLGPSPLEPASRVPDHLAGIARQSLIRNKDPRVMKPKGE